MVRTKPDAKQSNETWEEDARLAATAASGDPFAQRQFIKKVLPSVRRTMSYMSSEVQLVDDLTQIALVRILLKSGNYSGNGPLGSWANRVASRAAFSELNKMGRQRRLSEGYLESQRTLMRRREDEDDNRFALKQKLARILSKLKEKHRVVLVLRHIEGYSVAEIASIMDTPVNTTRGRLGIARAKLRKAVEREPELTEQFLGRETH